MLSFQRVILWPLLALIFFIIYYFDKIYLVKIHFYSRTLSPGSNKSERKQRIQDNFVGDCESKIERTRGAPWLLQPAKQLMKPSSPSSRIIAAERPGRIPMFKSLANLRLWWKIFQAGEPFLPGVCLPQVTLLRHKSHKDFFIRSITCEELELPEEMAEIDQEELDNPLGFSILAHGYNITITITLCIPQFQNFPNFR